MKKITTTLLVLFTSFGAFSQITIDSLSMPQSGDTLRYSIAAIDSTVLNTYLKSDTDLVWNYDKLIPIRQGLEEFVKSSETPYSSSIKNRIGQKLGDTITLGGFSLMDVYDFHLNSKSEFVTDHRATSIPTGLNPPFPATFSIAEPHKDKDEVYQFPLDYADRDSSTYEFTFKNTFPAGYYSSSGYRINEVDAWGELTTPFGTFDCIRVITDIVGYDTINFNGNAFGFSSHLREYKWLSNELRIPALTISGTVINDSTFIPTTVEYRDIYRGLPSIFSPVPLFAADDRNPQVYDTVRFSNLTFSLIPTRYKWDIKPNTFQYLSGSTQTSDSITVVFSDTGLYDIQLIAANSGGRDTLLIENYIRVDSSTTGIDEFNRELSKQVSIIPNPTIKTKEFIISYPTDVKVLSIAVIDVTGRIVNSKKGIESSNIKMNSIAQSGIYFIVLETSKGAVTKRLVIK